LSKSSSHPLDLSLVRRRKVDQIETLVVEKKTELAGRTIILGVTGSIAAYKAADLTSRLAELGSKVYPVLTDNATRFISPLTLQTLARNPASVDLWAEESGWQPGHIELADQADLLLVAPASAHCLALFAHGLAPDLLSSIYLATEATVMLAPAMNGEDVQPPCNAGKYKASTGSGLSFYRADEWHVGLRL
jgi:Phosphopantothenoylcysteine synthetase/decarboxylase